MGANSYFSRFDMLKFRLSSSLNSMGSLVNTLCIYPTFIGDLWILNDYLNVMILRTYDEKEKEILQIALFDVKIVQWIN